MLTYKAVLRYFKHHRIPKARGSRCIIAGNGPSLSENLKTNLDILKKEPVFCVNHFANSPEFSIIKPDYYCMIDPNFFRLTASEELQKSRDRTFHEISTRTNWDMHLFLPFYPGQIMLEDYFSTKHLQMHIFHIFPGFHIPIIRNLIYRTGLLMPRAQNVLIPAIFQAINMGYKEIYLLGAKHSWLEDITVKDDNVLYTTYKHFSGTSTEAPIYKAAPRNTETFKMHELLDAFYITFRSYWMLNEYAKSRGTIIYNSTPHSFIDAFERKDLSELSK